MSNRSAEVAILGAGLIGTAIAWRLSQQGVQVRLYDAGTVGGEASSAGAGMLSPGGEFSSPSVWVDLGVESLRLYPKFVEELRGESGLPIDFRICGCQQFTGPEEARRAAAFQSRAGIRVELTPEGLFYPDDGLVNPVELVRALRSACERRGVRIVEHHAVQEIEASDYANVVVAAGAWSGRIAVTFRGQRVPLSPTTPVKGHLVGFCLPPGSLDRIRRSGHTYVLQRSNGFVVAGSTEQEAGFERQVDPAICADIHQRAGDIFPPLLETRAVDCWVGFRPRLADGSGPAIGNVAGTNVWRAFGHYRNGILLTPITASRVASGILAN